VEEYEALHTLALLLLESRFGREPDARLLPARIPTGLPIEVPIPAATRVIGSWAQPGRAHILLETELDAPAVDTFYREELLAQGLRELDLTHPAFFHSGIGGELQEDLGLSDSELEAVDGSDWAQSTYRVGADGPLVVLRAQRARDGLGSTAVEIEVGADPSEIGLDDESDGRHAEHERIHRLLPVLTPPAGIQTWGGGESWGSDDAHVEASMLTSLAVEAVAGHFNSQIAERGWSEVESGVCDRVAWSQWERNEEDIGIIELLWFALRLPTEPPEYVLRLHATRKNPRRPWNRLGGGGSLMTVAIVNDEEDGDD
jgi:hypothetical protein